MSDSDNLTTAQRNIGDFAPKLVSLTDDVLFGDIWEREELSKRDRSLVTVAALIAGGNTEQLKNHLARAKANGLTENQLKGSNHPSRVLRRLAARDVGHHGREERVRRLTRQDRPDRPETTALMRAVPQAAEQTTIEEDHDMTTDQNHPGGVAVITGPRRVSVRPPPVPWRPRDTGWHLLARRADRIEAVGRRARCYRRRHHRGRHGP